MAIIKKMENVFSGLKPQKRKVVTSVGPAPESMLKKPVETTIIPTPDSFKNRNLIADVKPISQLPPGANSFAVFKPATATTTENQAGVQGQNYLQQTLNGQQPLIDTSAQFRAGDRALARGANDLRNANDQAMAQAGQMGQGQEIKSAQATEQNIFAQLAGRETEKAVQGIQEQRDQRARQDTAANTLASIGLNRDTLQLQKDQFNTDDEFRGASLALSQQAQRSTDYFKAKGIESDVLKNIMEVGGDNPAVVRKAMQNYFANNGLEYTQADEDEMNALIAENKKSPDTKIADMSVELLGLQIEKAKKDLENPQKKVTANNLATGDVNPDDFTDEEWAGLGTSEISAIKKTNDYKVWNEMPKANSKVWNQTNEGEIVFVGAVPYRYEGNFQLTNLKTGKNTGVKNDVKESSGRDYPNKVETPTQKPIYSPTKTSGGLL